MKFDMSKTKTKHESQIVLKTADTICVSHIP